MYADVYCVYVFACVCVCVTYHRRVCDVREHFLNGMWTSHPFEWKSHDGRVFSDVCSKTCWNAAHSECWRWWCFLFYFCGRGKNGNDRRIDSNRSSRSESQSWGQNEEGEKKETENRFPFARPLHIQQPKAANNEYTHYADNNESVCHSRLSFFYCCCARTTTPLHLRVTNFFGVLPLFLSFSHFTFSPSLGHPPSPSTPWFVRACSVLVCVCHSFVNTLVSKSSPLLCSVPIRLCFCARLWQCLNSLACSVSAVSVQTLFRMLLSILLSDIVCIEWNQKLVTSSHTNCNRSWKILMQSFYTCRQSCKQAYASIRTYTLKHIHTHIQRGTYDVIHLHAHTEWCHTHNYNSISTFSSSQPANTRYQNTLPNGIQTLFHTIN